MYKKDIRSCCRNIFLQVIEIKGNSMQEYLVYAIIIFVPIAALMEYLLRKEGLAITYRVIIVTASLTIIISFPILMGNLGILLALILYLASIIALSWYFIMVMQGPAWYLRKGNSHADDEVFVSERLIKNTQINTLGEIEDALWLQENSDNMSVDSEAEESSSSIENMPANSTNAGDMNKMSESQQVKQDQMDEFNGETSHINETDEQPGEDLIAGADELEETAKSAAAIEDKAEELESSVLMNLDNLSKEDEPNQIEFIEKAEANERSYPDQENDDLVAQTSQFDSLETITGISQEASQTSEAEMEMLVNTETNGQEDLIEAPSVTEAVIMVEDNEQFAADNDVFIAAPAQEMETPALSELTANAEQAEATEDLSPDETQESGLNVTSETHKLDFLIENGFALKQTKSLLEAVQLFKEALELSMNEELKFLLTMEIVELYKELGMYAQAEQVLFISIGKAYTRTDIIDKIERQLSYIRLLSLELDRLGLANTPISEVPRMVKINVAEILEV